MIRADNRPLEKRPDAFYGIGMDIIKAVAIVLVKDQR